MLLPWRWPRPCRGLSLVSSLWTAWVMLAAAAADRQGGELCSPVVCGGVNISFPFGNIADHATEANCGVLGFQVRCTNNTPYLGSYKGDYRFKILDIFYGDTSLLIADVHKLEDFNASASSSFKQPCYSPKNNCSAKLGYPFSISPANQNIIFYNCEETPTQAVRQSRGLVDTACGNKTLVGVAKRPDVPGSYFMEGCNATVVPMLVRSGEANPANYKELISDGFLLTWQEQPLPPPSPPSAAGETEKQRTWQPKPPIQLVNPLT
ncbi:hypothetical protein SORBI_3003G080800 [Sorghum bicolor]|uniref:Wall-associated receptor kinase galacturonan-binding domain-containing protein n=1 Tax=Sorghum bicolor TaxID=4558 RepID=A0A1W0VW61_SORBI|nr:hypothetical protein SORBI_3003G080800 [Sorghum bicolor]